MSEVRDLANRIMMALARGVLRMSSDAGKRQQIQIELLEGELRDQIEVMQFYGVYSRPLVGADYAVAFLGGNREQGIAIASADRRYHLQLLEGEVALADDLGNVIRLGRDKLTITAKTALEIAAPAIKITGPVTINGNITTTGTITNNGKKVDSTHTHGGVTPGSGTTGAPS